MPSPVSPRIKRDPQPSPIPGFLTTAEISARYNVTQEHISLLARQGKLPGSVKIGHDWLILESAWVKYNESIGDQGAPRGPRD